MIRRCLTAISFAFLAIGAAHAQAPAWKALLGDLPKAEKTGFGGLCGIAVDRQTGAVFINLSDRGFYRSDAGGANFVRISNAQPKGRTESPGCFLLDPTGKTKTLVTALVYGDPISISTDQGKSWQKMDGASKHVDWCAVDWASPESSFVLTLKHEAGGLLLASRDGGKSFEPIGKGYGSGWVFDNKTAVVAQAKTKDRPTPQLMRTTDAGKSWEPCGQFSPVGKESAQALPRWHGNTLYWLTEEGLITTKDKGAKWEKLGAIKNARFGPVLGNSPDHLFVLTSAGIVESNNGGADWSASIAPPQEMKGIGGLSWLDYDPTTETLYLMKMGSDLYALNRKDAKQ